MRCTSDTVQCTMGSEGRPVTWLAPSVPHNRVELGHDLAANPALDDGIQLGQQLSAAPGTTPVAMVTALAAMRTTVRCTVAYLATAPDESCPPRLMNVRC